MIRAVLDTNIIVGVLIGKGPSPLQSIFEAFQSQVFLHITSIPILREFENVLNRENIVKLHKLSKAERYIILKELTTKSYIVPDVFSVDIIKDDPDDNKFISAAIEGSASYVISGDRHLLDIGEYEGIKIVKARNFLEDILHKDIKWP